MVKYMALSRYTIGNLVSDVQNYLNQGWKLQGGTSVAMTDTYGNQGDLEAEYVQAVYKDE